MNPAIRYSSATPKALAHSWIGAIVDRANFSLPLMLSAVVISALGVIYMANLGRNLNADLERATTERAQLHVEWEQLLLEKGTLTRQSRVQQYASDRLQMVTPDASHTVALQE